MSRRRIQRSKVSDCSCGRFAALKMVLSDFILFSSLFGGPTTGPFMAHAQSRSGESRTPKGPQRQRRSASALAALNDGHAKTWNERPWSETKEEQTIAHSRMNRPRPNKTKRIVSYPSFFKSAVMKDRKPEPESFVWFRSFVIFL